jgi:UDP-2-acetamido-2-deoxy-ribo-hexuluronate aminotransferase
MEFINLAEQQKRVIERIESNIRAVLEHGKYIMGPEVYALEETLGRYVGVKHAISCASGTDALLMALMACNIGKGDAVFTTPFTFFATAEVISLAGATPVFVDIDRDTFNMDPRKLERTLEIMTNNSGDANRLNAKAVMPVDLFGLTADYDSIGKIARDHCLVVIEDAAQSFGAEYKNKKAGDFGDIACTSFFPAKPLGCYGDGGMCFTDNDEMAKILKSIRVHGQGDHKYDNVRIGINGRLDTLQAAILLAKFEIFDDEITLRQEVAHRYDELLSQIPAIRIPSVPRDYMSAWAQYSILAEDEEHRRIFLEALNQEEIPTAIYYPKPLHRQDAFSSLLYKTGDFPVSENVAQRIFSLPMHPYLNPEDQQKIAIILQNAIH